MGGLAAGRGAGVQHAHPRLDSEQGRRQLRGGVLHRGPTLGKSGQRGGFDRFGQRERRRGRRHRLGVFPRRRQSRAVHVAAALEPVDPQGEGWPGVVGGDDGRPVVRPVPLQPFQQPARMGRPGFRVGLYNSMRRRGKDRSTALVNPAAQDLRSWRAAATVSATAAWSGIRK